MPNQSLPLQEIIARIAAPKLDAVEKSPSILSGIGTMQSLNQRLVNYPVFDFINYNLRGIGQVIFVNNPLSGLLILLALFIFSLLSIMLAGALRTVINSQEGVERSAQHLNLCLSGFYAGGIDLAKHSRPHQ